PSPIRDNAAGSGTAGAKNWISAAPGLAPLAATTCHLTNWAVTGVSLTVVKSAALVGLAAAGLITSKVVLPVPKFGSLLKVRVESVTLSKFPNRLLPLAPPLLVRSMMVVDPIAFGAPRSNTTNVELPPPCEA